MQAMPSPFARWLRDPLFLLCLTAGLLAFVVQSGELGTADTAHRLQTTHWLWTSEPQVFPYEYPEFGLHGRGGRLYSWYGIGQSLLMLPSDLLGTWIAHWSVFSDYEDDRAASLQRRQAAIPTRPSDDPRTVDALSAVLVSHDR